MIREKNCTAVLVGKNASENGSPIYCHLEDNGIDDAVHLIYFPRVRHSEKNLKLSHVEIPQTSETFRHWGIVLAPETPMSKEAIKEAPTFPWLLCGMNEYGVSLGAHGVFSKQPLRKKEGLTFFEVNKLVLERTKNAREAVDLIGQLVKEYGQMGMGTNNAYCIGASDGCWIVEVAAENWVAKRCPDDSILAYANQYLIDTEWNLASNDLVKYAKKKSWYNPDSGEKFSFRQSYGKNLDVDYSTLREQRIRNLLETRLGHITVEDVMSVTRDHYEGTEHSRYTTIDKGTSEEPYMYPPHKSPYRTICVPRTQASMVCNLRNDMPRQIGNIMWLCMSSPCTSVYVPIYAGSSEAPEEYMKGKGQYDNTSAWWIFDKLQRLVDESAMRRSYVSQIWSRHEQKEFKRQREFEKLVVQVYEYNPTLAKDLLTEYTYQRLDAALDKAKILCSQGLRRSLGQRNF